MALGVALLGVVFFTMLGHSSSRGADAESFSRAFSGVLLLASGILVVVSAGFLTLPSTSKDATEEVHGR